MSDVSGSSNPSPTASGAPVPQTADAKAPPAGKPDPKAAITGKSEAKADAGHDAGKAPQGGEVAPKPPQKFKFALKVDGQDIEEEYDESTLKRELQMSKAAQKRMQEAAQLKKEVAQLLAQVRENPLEALRSEVFGGLDVKEMVRQQLIQEYEESLAPPQDKEKLELQKKLQAYEARIKAAEEQEKQRAQAEMDKRVETEMRQTLKNALELSGLPQTRETLYEIANVMRINLARGLDLTPEQLAAETARRLDGYTSRYLGDLDGEALAKRLGPEVTKKLVKYMVEKNRASAAQAVTAPPAEPVVSPVQNDEPKKKSRMTPEEKAKWKRELYFGRDK